MSSLRAFGATENTGRIHRIRRIGRTRKRRSTGSIGSVGSIGFIGSISWPVGVLLLTGLLLSCGEDEGPPTGTSDAGGRQDASDAGGRSEAGRDLFDQLAAGEACREDLECASQVCARFEGEEEGFCTEFCLDDSDCPFSQWVCLLVLFEEGEAAQICLPHDLCVDLDEDRYGIGPGCEGADCDDDDIDVKPGVDEICDGIDNDCNGSVDDNAIDDNAPCITGLDGVCAAGIGICIAGELFCEATVVAGPEICDGVDNDCDGLTDEDEEGNLLTVPCYGGTEDTRGVGVCADGYRECKSGGFTDCIDEVLPSLEICDGLDNDCDGTVDDGNPGGGRPCDTELPGLCARGLTACQGGEVVCLPADAEDEICDGVDNDCDGHVDEAFGVGPADDFEPLTRACYNGPEETRAVGECRDGVQTCTLGEWGICDGEVQPTPEICDRLDNDCDDTPDCDDPSCGIDEEVIGGGFPCDTGLPGICGAGISRCDETGSFCDQIFEAQEVEICDGLDNDCDGYVDNAQGVSADDTLVRPCYDGPAGTLGHEGAICQEGSRDCAGGELGDCEGQVLPTAEQCDAVDNDCDGVNNENNPGSAASCDTGEAGVCAAGVTDCVGTELTCEPLNEPSAEVCDGRDNDCDGHVDEAPGVDAGDAFVALTRSCYGGPAGTEDVGACQGGTQTCSGGDFGDCLGQVLPQTELCDDVDNDCDDTGACVAPDRGVTCGTDEGQPEAGFLCTTTEPGVCKVGTMTCSGGALSCVPNTTGSGEICNGLDDDCNGHIDDGIALLGQVCYLGAGICRRAGVYVCNEPDTPGEPPDPEVVCDAVPGDPADAEVCNFVDDDCDDTEACVDPDRDVTCGTDEGFQVGGVYSTVENCGACGINCENLWPEGVELAHALTGCVLDEDTGAYGCGYECTDGYEDADGVEDNGCEFLPDPDAIYVSTYGSGGRDTADCGAWETPCETINHGIDRAVDPDGDPLTNDRRLRVVVSDGVYRERVQLEDGISLLGGHNSRSWARDPEVNVTVIKGVAEEGAPASDRIAVQAVDIDGQLPDGTLVPPTIVSGFTIETESATDGFNSVGVYILDSDENLQLNDADLSAGTPTNVIIAGNGGEGVRGTDGDQGTDGADGGDGHDSWWFEECGCDTDIPECIECPDGVTGNCLRPGGDGGSRECPNPDPVGDPIDVSGGRGGDSDCPLTPDPDTGEPTINGAGDDAAGSECVDCPCLDDGTCPGYGGRGGSNMSGEITNVPGGTVRTCNIYLDADENPLPTDALPGNSGVAGDDGTGGSGAADPFAGIDGDDLQWRGASGLVGTLGLPGLGGGGGGAGPGVHRVRCQGNVDDCEYYGASGGGGGSGGCPGDPGEGGGPGGGSFAILMVFTAPPADAGSMPVVEGNQLVRGLGGAGGEGGTGGAGGDPGLGGLGGAVVFDQYPDDTDPRTDDPFAFCLEDAAGGATGGRGGHGGGGGGGAGGISFDVLVAGSDGLDPGYLAGNTFEIDDGIDTAGPGGPGGGSSNTTTGLGSDGVNGESGNLILVP